MDATELARWTRFASKGGIGTCTAVEDCIAETPEDLMFLKGDEIVVLFQEAESYLGFCEGVVGRFEGSRVRFHAKLKRPVMTKRSSMAAKSPQPSPVPPSPSLGRMSSFTTNESLALKTPPLEPLSSPESPDTARPWAHSKTPSATSVSSFGQHARFLTSSSSSSAASNSISQLSQGPLNGGVLPRGSLASLPEQQQRNTVLSTVSSEGDENAGIGFNFLQAGSDDSDDDDDLPQRQRTHTGSSSTSSQYARASIERPRPESPPQRTFTDSSTTSSRQRSNTESSVQSFASISSLQSYQERRLSPPPTIEELLVQRRERGSPSSTSTPNGTQGGGYFDIYDDYRYSRASSIATNATRERARSGSIASSIASSLRKMNEEIPPVPDARPSLDSQADRPSTSSSVYSDMEAPPSGEGAGSSTAHGHSAAATAAAAGIDISGFTPSHSPSDDEGSVYSSSSVSESNKVTQPLRVTNKLNSPLSPNFPPPKKGPPAPLNLLSPDSAAFKRTSHDDAGQTLTAGEGQTPLLHTSWGSPLSSSGFDSNESEEHTRVAPAPLPTDAVKSPKSAFHVANPDVDSDSPPPPSYHRASPSPPLPSNQLLNNAFSRPISDDVSEYSDEDEDEDRESLGDEPTLVIEQHSGDEEDGQDVVVHRGMEFDEPPSPLVPSPHPSQNMPPSPMSLVPPSPSSMAPPSPTSSLNVPSSPLLNPHSPLIPQPPSHLRPVIKDVRSDQRTSLFSPHPGAPISPQAAVTASFENQQQPQQQPGIVMVNGVARTWAGGALGSSSSPAQNQPPGMSASEVHKAKGAKGTVYGRLTVDLSQSFGPVPISFVTEPPPLPPMPPSQGMQGRASPLAQSPPRGPPPSRSPQPQTPPRMRPLQSRPSLSSLGSPASPSPSTPKQALHGSSSTSNLRGSPGGANGVSSPLSTPTASPGAGMGISALRGSVSSSNLRSPLAVPDTKTPLQPQQPNILPGAPSSASPLPRSNFVPKIGPTGSRPRSRSFSGMSEMASSSGAHKSFGSFSGVAPPVPVPANGFAFPKSSDLSSSSSSSPSPLQNGFQSPSPSSPSPPNNHRRPSTSSPHSNLRSPLPRRSPLAVSTASPVPPTQSLNSPTESTLSPAPRRGDSIGSPRSANFGPVPPQPSPSVGRQNSLRSKLSLPNLRHSPSVSPSISSAHFGTTAEKVRGMDFEFVRPAQDGREGAGSVMSMRSSVSQGRPSFATSHHTTAPSSPSSSSPTSTINRPPSSMAAPPNTAQSVAAHRARELKWVQLLPTLNPATSRKNKKVKKLIWEGSVPSSVRYEVWMCLCDGRAKKVKGVYDGFKARRARNVGGDGEVGALLGAYLGMVPDIVYSIGLSQIVNQLLQLAPEEDAFWIFVSLMDLYLRPYFSSSITQLEVDASLFSKALEANDPQLAKKLLVELGIEPRMIVRGWWESLFVGVLPPEWAERVWDVFLFEGIPFLIRTTLAVLTCSRRTLLTIQSNSQLLSILHPMIPPGSTNPHLQLPDTPDGLVSLAASFKVKDDDVRKMRVKMEAQVKKQEAQGTRARRMTLTGGGGAVPPIRMGPAPAGKF